MTLSYRRIDYSVRPAKYAERKFMLDILAALRGFGPMSSVRYIGFGSIWFSDFELFHRYLGIPDMVSIEWAGSMNEQRRFNFNVPYKCISMKYGKSTHVIPKISFKKRTITWLDYDGKFEPYMLDDARLVSSRAKSGSMFIVSFNAHSAKEIDEAAEESLNPLDLFRERFSFPDEILPDKETDLYAERFIEFVSNMYEVSISEALTERKISEQKEFLFKRICKIRYADGAPMATLIYVIFEKKHENKFEECGFEQLEAIKQFGSDIRIDTPSLTLREVRAIEQSLPGGESDITSFLPEGEVAGFSKFYRYMPNFAAIER